ncbi:MAG: Fe-S cluster assembly protein SufB [Alphaproteobacteria bacterium]|jgi:Fe-S cluster assembly protein SufB|nr:Fe-S cluster assembly protein SufB [Alphaproteobacteria bacterium]
MENLVNKKAVDAAKKVSDNYKAGFYSDVENEEAPKGLSKEVIEFISKRKGEPEELLKWRLDAYEKWLKMKEPHWASFDYDAIDYQSLSYYISPKSLKENAPKSLDEVDPEILKTYQKLGLPIKEQEQLAGVVAVDMVFDSTSVGTTYQGKLKEHGVIFCSMQEAVRNHWPLVKKYIGSVVPKLDNFYAALNSAVFSDGTFVYVPKGVKCPIELGSYFRMNAKEAGQFERTLIVADEGAEVSYLEGCSAPQHDTESLHGGVVEVVALKDSVVKYSTVQNWYSGDKDGKGGILNFVTKRAIVNENAKVSWTQLEVGASKTWKYPSCILRGDNSIGEFYSVALTNNKQMADTGTKMIHIGKNTKSTIISKGIALEDSENTYRGLVKVSRNAEGARNFTACDSLVVGDKASSHTFPVIEDRNSKAVIEHEASTSRINEDQLLFLRNRGLSEELAVSMVVNGFVGDIVKKLPDEFAMEAKALINIKIEGQG